MVLGIKGLYHLLVAIFSNIWFRFPARKLTVIGVTGTDGKTTTATLIYSILKTAGYSASMITSVHAVIGSKTYDTGFHVTTPGSFMLQKYLRSAVDSGDTHMVLEVTSHGLSQSRVWGIRFAVGVLTNVTHEHLDFHKTFSRYLLTKLSLLRRSAICVVNRDEAEVYNKIIPKLRRKKIITYALRRDAVITPKTYRFSTKLSGIFNTYNCLAAIGVGYALGIGKKTMLHAIASFTGISGRMESIQDAPFRVIIDFAHTPNAIEQVLKTVRPITKKRLIHVFGSAARRDIKKRAFMGNASAKYADLIVLTEEDYRNEDVGRIIDMIASGIPSGREVVRIPDRSEAIYYAVSHARPGDTVIITGKGHELSLARGNREYPWSDQAEARKILKKIS
ncbi:MAG: UDP-N-acetylmuramoyl-L-alanyl-D-glutamate--2,6-diaminopimelate ligase [bacterium]|nr:UDP-N-acetylmuramoyl-L-alanyl-D-glutamate--2,6-diaminopimelate ligase [bacterium]